MKIHTVLVFLSFQLAIIGCKKEDNKTTLTPANHLNDSIQVTKAEETIDYTNFNIYSISAISSVQNNQLADVFISVSDTYTDPLPVQDDLIKKQNELSFDQLQYIELDSKHRKKMMDALHLTENDTLYLFNYELNKLQKTPLQTLKAVAYLTPYAPEGEEVDPGSYMVGFQIEAGKDADAFSKYDHAIAYFGNKNPFTEGKMQAVKWKKTGADHSKKYFSHSKLKPGNTFQAQYENLTYYLQDYLEDETVQERKLVVINDRNEKIFEKTIIHGGDGSEFSPLNGIEADEAGKTQWTGHLLKGKPPVIFGFVSQSFGCPSITFMDKDQKDMLINCDNRH